MASTQAPKGYLVVKVLEAAGHNSNDVPVWDASFDEGYVRVEIRGGPKTIRKATQHKPVTDNSIEWDEQLAIEVHEGASELRIMLCRDKMKTDDKLGTSIVAACGIYMQDILDSVPIDKYFELFKPGMGAEGGFIRVSMSYLLPDQVRSGNGQLSGEEKAEGPVQRRRGGNNSINPWVLAAGAVAAVAAIALSKVLGGQSGSKVDPKKCSKGDKSDAKK